jgi:hypothetical protein
MPQQLLPFTPFNLPSHLWPKVGGHDTKKAARRPPEIVQLCGNLSWHSEGAWANVQWPHHLMILM